MTLPLPPLHAVRAFVAAARHLSFTRAAAELHVTHGAVSRQVKILETHLGVALFERRVRQVVLTAEGAAFFGEAQAGLMQIGQAARTMMARVPGRAVRINVRPSFALRWLIPRLPDFVAQYPGIEPQVITTTAAPAKVTDDYDVAIRRGLQGWPTALQIRPYLPDEAIVVGAPERFGKPGTASPRTLSSQVLLHSRSRRNDWDQWWRHAGLGRLKPAGTLQFDHLHLVLQAAQDGLGVAVAPRSLLARDLERGRLVAPWPQLALPLEPYYYGLAPEAAAETQFFAQWLDDALNKTAI
ncbi:MAG: LysR family transcriptional regulator [Curvibacter sp.]|nr:LysR family transcriptional regulator [Curvibacter sp.]